jgi:hypothetical protein
MERVEDMTESQSILTALALMAQAEGPRKANEFKRDCLLDAATVTDWLRAMEIAKIDRMSEGVAFEILAAIGWLCEENGNGKETP